MALATPAAQAPVTAAHAPAAAPARIAAGTPADDAITSGGDDGALRRRIAHLEGQVAALQAALTRRSDEMRLLQSLLCQRDLARLGRLAEGLPQLPRLATDPEAWQETQLLTTAEVPETLEDLWASIYPPASR
jgi:hypothetical protein